MLYDLRKKSVQRMGKSAMGGNRPITAAAG
jgi:hypothetical protein